MPEETTTDTPTVLQRLVGGEWKHVCECDCEETAKQIARDMKVEFHKRFRLLLIQPDFVVSSTGSTGDKGK